MASEKLIYTVETEELKKYYKMGPETVKALDGVNLRVVREVREYNGS